MTAVRITMEFFEHRYYRLSKILMTLTGLWPYQSAGARRGFLAIYTITFISGSVPQVLAYIKYHNDWRVVLDGIIPCLFATCCAIKFIGALWNSEKALKLLNRICTNCQERAQDRDVHILHEYAKQGEKMTILYTDLSILLEAAVYLTIILFTTQPIIPKIVDVMVKNGTEPGKFPYPVDYHFFDSQKYYYYVMVHFYLCACVVAMPLVASDSMLIMCVQHVCGIFAAMGYKLEQIGSNGTSVKKGETLFEVDKRHFVYVTSFIDTHNDAIEYANLINATYTWIFFCTLGPGMILINILGLQILMRSDDPGSTVRFVVMVFSFELVWYTECYISQMLEDHSMNIGYYIHNSRWYRLSNRAQKLLNLMTMRCRVPCQLTAWKLVVISLSTFERSIRAAISYFAVLRSMGTGLNNT